MLHLIAIKDYYISRRISAEAFGPP